MGGIMPSKTSWLNYLLSHFPSSYTELGYSDSYTNDLHSKETSIRLTQSTQLFHQLNFKMVLMQALIADKYNKIQFID